MGFVAMKYQNFWIRESSVVLHCKSIHLVLIIKINLNQDVLHIVS